MHDDRTELNDLAEGDADRVQRLAALYESDARASDELPWPVPFRQRP